MARSKCRCRKLFWPWCRNPPVRPAEAQLENVLERSRPRQPTLASANHLSGVSAPAEWVSDDPSITDDEVVYRRVTKNAPGALTIDRISGETHLGTGAFSLNPRDRAAPAGCSVCLESLMRQHEIPTSRLAKWETQGVGRFHARDVRRGKGGIVASEDPEDTELGKAHALLRTKSPGLPRAEWLDIRSAILEQAIYFESDPGFSDATNRA